MIAPNKLRSFLIISLTCTLPRPRSLATARNLLDFLFCLFAAETQSSCGGGSTWDGVNNIHLNKNNNTGVACIFHSNGKLNPAGVGGGADKKRE